jgi:hypothetical protein
MMMMMMMIIIIIIINLRNVQGEHVIKEIQKAAILGASHILQKC